MEAESSRKKKNKYQLYGILAAGTILLLAVLVYMGFRIWTKYKSDLMDNQKEEMQLVTKTLTQNLEVSMQEYLDDLSLMLDEEKKALKSGVSAQPFYDTYFASRNSFVYDLRWEKEDGSFIKSYRNEEMTDFITLTWVDEETEIYQCTGADGNFYMGIRRPLTEDTWLCLVMDSQAYYEFLIQDIHVGTNGYIVIKNSDGRIIMHPSYEQWGIDVIEGRKELFPDAEFTSLQEMIEKQKQEDSGLYEYTSYWWTDENVPRVRKISSHNHCQIGEDFWIVSAVVDYSDFYEPIQDSFQDIIAVFAGILLVAIVMMMIIGSLALTNKKRREEVDYLKQLNQTLEELHKSEQTISHQQRLQVIGAMTSGIVHEFNNFLTPIVGYADLLALDLEEGTEDYEYVCEITDAADKARDMIRQIASMSHRNIETVYKNFSVAQMIRRAMKMVATVCPPNVQVEESTNLANEEILGNVTQIHQVILNICVNGIHAIGSAGGKLTIFSEALPREEAANRFPNENISDQWKNYIHISIADNGCGMDHNVMSHIFEPFFTTKKAGQGTGLGLSMADQIIRYHRGCISVESKPGEGSTFHLLLPQWVEGMEKEEENWSRENKITILIADDNQKILELLEREFESMGVVVKTCSRREEIDDILRTSSAQILAIDENLADGYGIDYCMSIAGKYPDMYRLLMADLLTREVLEAKQRGIISNYVTKPVSAAMLIAAAREVVC